MSIALFPINNVAATLPEVDKILQDATQPNRQAPIAPVLPPKIAPPAELPKPTIPNPAAEIRINVTRFTFTGNEAINDATLGAALSDSENKSLNFGELMVIVERVEAIYKAAGYFLAQAYLAPQKIKDGTIEINISEGKLGQTRIEGESRIKPNIIYTLLDQLPKGRAVKLTEIERQVLLINDLAGSSATLDVQASETPGFTDIVIAQKLEPLLSGRVEGNNHGMPATGERHLGLFLNANSPNGLGDRLSANLMRSSNGNIVSYGLNYDLPVGGNGWHLTTGASLSQYKIASGPSAGLKATGNIKSIRIGAIYPLHRSRDTNLNLRLDLAHNRMYSDSLVDNNENSSNVITNALSFDWSDKWLSGGINHAEIFLAGGQLDLGASARLGDNRTNGAYGKALLTLQREQTLHPKLTLQTQLTHQQSSKNLDGSEKFSIGGPGSMPGYGGGEASGDDGTLLKLKFNWRMRPDTSLGLFTDFATLKAAHHPVASSDCNANPMVTRNRCHFHDAGLSIDWQNTRGYTASVLVAWAFHEKPNPADNDRPRLWANLGFNW